jgi:hypothetical protein
VPEAMHEYTVMIAAQPKEVTVWARNVEEAVNKAPLMIGIAGFRHNAAISAHRREAVSPNIGTAA